ncbi:hypothetical protein TYRP_006381 [Tyrophagus putrescentiae]|nr:hypothetical protein TYRP_006381 [Tyrophagus putrescentiae]
MKFSVIALFLLLGTFCATTATDVNGINSTPEDVVVNGTTAAAAVVIASSSTKAPVESGDAITTTNVPVKDSNINGNVQQQAPPKEPQQPKLDPSSLHRVPVYEDRHQESTPAASSKNSATDAAAPKLVELPIPSRCPAITGTEATVNNGDLLPLLGADLPRAAQRGCRFFIMTELMDRSSPAYLHASAAEQINRTLEGCLTSCTHAYDNGTVACAACQEGCRKTALVTEAAKKSSSSASEAEDGEDSSNDEEGPHRSFSIIVPLIGGSRDESESGTSNGADSDFQSNMPRALQSMMAMMHSLAERARQSMAAQREADEGGNGLMDPRGGAISVSRSMSVVMTRDKDGHQKVVVVHQLPRISIHRETFGGMDQDNAGGEDDAVRRFEELFTGGAGKSEDLRERYFGHLANGGGSGHRSGSSSSNYLKNGHSLEDEDALVEGVSSESTQAYYYRSRLCYLLPRLFYVTLMILSLYLVFWLCCVASTTVAARSARLARGGAGTGGENGNGAGGSVAVMADGKLKKLFLSKQARYYKLNNKTGRSNSTTSLPPPYPAGEAGNTPESCAEPLPEKTPLPEGGLEVGGK